MNERTLAALLTLAATAAVAAVPAPPVAAAGPESPRLMPGNIEPLAYDDFYLVPSGATFVVDAPGVLANDYDRDGLLSSLSAYNVTTTSNGSLVLFGDGSFEYTPDSGFNGLDEFEYRVADPEGGVSDNAAVVRLSVLPPVVVDPTSIPPVGMPDYFEVAEGTTLRVAAPGLLANDFDPDGGSITVADAYQSANGTHAVRPDGSFEYTPDSGFAGLDWFYYMAEDGEGDRTPPVIPVYVLVLAASAPATTVAAAAPVGGDDAFEVAADTSLDIPAPGVLVNDSDLDGDVVSVARASQPNNGTVEINQDGSFRYVPAPGFTGIDKFRYAVVDGDGNRSGLDVVVTIRVSAPEDAATTAPATAPATTEPTVDPDETTTTQPLPDDATTTSTLVGPAETAPPPGAHGIHLAKSSGGVDDVDGDGIDAGDTVTYYFVVTNIGIEPLPDVTVDDPLVGGPLSCGSEPLPPATSRQCDPATYTLSAADLGATLVNTATAIAQTTAGATVTASDTAVTLVPPSCVAATTAAPVDTSYPDTSSPDTSSPDTSAYPVDTADPVDTAHPVDSAPTGTEPPPPPPPDTQPPAADPPPPPETQPPEPPGSQPSGLRHGAARPTRPSAPSQVDPCAPPPPTAPPSATATGNDGDGPGGGASGDATPSEACDAGVGHGARAAGLLPSAAGGVDTTPINALLLLAAGASFAGVARHRAHRAIEQAHGPASTSGDAVTGAEVSR
jgi:uncharacterized repeat protein (TIGR01451 family)